MIFDKEKFRALRESRGLSLEDVGRSCGVSQSIVSRWESPGKCNPRPAKIPQLAAILHCEESDLAQYGGRENVFDFKRDYFVRRRLDLGLTQQQIADACGVSESSVCGWENGVNAPRPRRIAKIAEILRCEKSDLVRCGDAAPPDLAGIVAALEQLLSELKRYAEKNKEQKQK